MNAEIDIQDARKDAVLMERSTEITSILIDGGGFTLDKIAELVKDFQRKYLAIKNTSLAMAKEFTPDVWRQTMSFNEK
jgi:hypothetical protein